MARRQPKPARLKKSVAEFVRWERVCRVATVSADGTAHVVPVCHVLAGEKLYFGSGDDAGKIQNLRANPNVAIEVDVYSDAWSGLRGVMIQGTARLIERGPAFQRARKLLYAKYPQYPKEAAISPSDSVIVEVTLAHVFSWGLP
jgi:nitroimidazol reductase NimA-like FMN-containing flavoprotein (pyridoxamine 5'-phosphate oxidase superfamily)